MVLLGLDKDIDNLNKTSREIDEIVHGVAGKSEKVMLQELINIEKMKAENAYLQNLTKEEQEEYWYQKNKANRWNDWGAMFAYHKERRRRNNNKKLENNSTRLAPTAPAPKRQTQSKPVTAGATEINKEPERLSAHKEKNIFSRFIGKPLSVVIPAMEKMGYVDRDSIDADEHPASHLYNIVSVSDNGQQIMWPNNWIVTAISLDEHKRSIVIDVTRRVKK